MRLLGSGSAAVLSLSILVVVNSGLSLSLLLLPLSQSTLNSRKMSCGLWTALFKDYDLCTVLFFTDTK